MTETSEPTAISQIRKIIAQPWLLFLGAGASVHCGVKPWRALAEGAIELGRISGAPPEALKYAENALTRGRLAMVFDAIEQELPRGAWTGWLKREVTPTQGFGELHTALFKLRPSGVITTNYDTIAQGCIRPSAGSRPSALRERAAGPPLDSSRSRIRTPLSWNCRWPRHSGPRGPIIPPILRWFQFTAGLHTAIAASVQRALCWI